MAECLKNSRAVFKVQLERKVGLCSNEAGCAQKTYGRDLGTKEVLILGKGVAAESFWFGILELFLLKSVGLEYI